MGGGLPHLSFLLSFPSFTRALLCTAQGLFSELRVAERTTQLLTSDILMFKALLHHIRRVLQTSYEASLSPCFLTHKTGVTISTSQSWNRGPDAEQICTWHISLSLSTLPLAPTSGPRPNIHPRAGVKCSGPSCLIGAHSGGYCPAHLSKSQVSQCVGPICI